MKITLILIMFFHIIDYYAKVISEMNDFQNYFLLLQYLIILLVNNSVLYLTYQIITIILFAIYFCIIYLSFLPLFQKIMFFYPGFVIVINFASKHNLKYKSVIYHNFINPITIISMLINLLHDLINKFINFLIILIKDHYE